MCVEPQTEAECEAAAVEAGLDLGGGGHAFAGTYTTSGCYAYSAGAYAGMAFWSTTGSPAVSGNPYQLCMPVALPSRGPSALPEPSPTVYPGDPTANPTTASPSVPPTGVPTAAPSSTKPSGSPTAPPTGVPTAAPSSTKPSGSPTAPFPTPRPTAACYVQVADGAAGESKCSNGLLSGFPGTNSATACYASCEGAYGRVFRYFVYTASESRCSCRFACSLTVDADVNSTYLVYERTCFDPTAAPTASPEPTRVPSAFPTSKPAPAPSVPSAGWYDGGAGLSCTDGCAAHGLACSEEQLFAHNGDVDSSAEVLALVTEVGGATSATECGDSYGDYPAVPNFKSDTCWISDTNRALSTFDCDMAHPTNPDVHRLCYCFSTDATPSARPSATPSLAPQPLPTSPPSGPPSFGPTFAPMPRPTSQPTPVSCVDDVRNGDETDIDCGGQCPPCENIGDACAVDSDCVSETCVASACSTPMPSLSPTHTPCDSLPEPAMPQLEEAKFSSTGGQFFVTWDKQTDRAGHGGDTFPCDTVLDFPGVDDADCTFTKRKELTVRLLLLLLRARLFLA